MVTAHMWRASSRGMPNAATSVTNLYDGGIAPGAQLVNVRVLGAQGTGYTSDVIAGIDWVIANQARYNIRVMNLSLGHPVGESCVTDPLCEAVARAVGAGIVVVASAGNDGRAANGAPILGGITSPGNSPFAITVGALNTWGTTDRSDDTVTDYSSRGPTKFDLAVKPDLAAPGNRIISLEANHGYLVDHYPVLHRAGSGTNAYMQLSGTSMAAPIVTRRGRVAAPGQSQPRHGAGEDGSPDRRNLRARWWFDGCRRRQPEHLGVAEDRREWSDGADDFAPFRAWRERCDVLGRRCDVGPSLQRHRAFGCCRCSIS